MSKTTEYLDEVKRAKGLTSNYALAKWLGIAEQDISRCYQGKKHGDEYICTRIALALGKEPIHVMAEIRAEAEKNKSKREFWLNFLSHAAVVIVLVTGLVLGFPSTSEADASTASYARSDRTDITANYARFRRWLTGMVSRLLSTPVFGAFAPA